MNADALEIGREYLLRANHSALLAVYTGMAAPPGAEPAEGKRELPRFCPLYWIRGEPLDPDWPVYAGSRARWRRVNSEQHTRQRSSITNRLRLALSGGLRGLLASGGQRRET